ncbi:hypothetical protein [Lysinibacillus fusiformis]|uniref:hypothetical protein n=1 Tax=Lysinibacillus fusiformis TaxID=28031 RepID=UPI0018813D0D|nr:hypothetical protein [Lysinibacillus fusiformis]MBD8524052.1 hypothetical protein [Lysinibacillus fusiformis]
MEKILFNVLHFEAPNTPITIGVMFKTATILAKEFPIISILIGVFFLFLIAQLIRFKIRKLTK